MTKKTEIILILGILVLGFFLRFYKLGSIPNGLYQDETDIGYNAYSILLTGKDEHNISWPIYFKSFGDYKLPVYIYLTAVTVKLFGLTAFAVRLPSALFGFLTLPFFYLLIRKLFQSKHLALTATFLLSVNPWHLQYNRATFEVSISLFLIILGSLFMFLSLAEKKKWYLLWGTLMFTLCIYTYNLTRLFSPLLYLITLITFKPKKFNVSKSETVWTVILNLLLLVPFGLTLFASGGAASAKGTLIFTSNAVQAPLLEFRSYILAYSPVFAKLLFNRFCLTLWQFIQNIAAYFSVDFFFIRGSLHGNHGIGNNGLFYLFELPFFVFGIYSMVIDKIKYKTYLTWWALLTITIAALTRDVPQATRSFFLIFPILIFTSYGVYSLVKLINVMSGQRKYYVYTFTGILIIYNFIYYFSSYYYRFPILYAPSWRSEDKEVADYIKVNESRYRKIIFDTKSGYIYSSLLFYNRISPDLLQNTSKWSADDTEGFSNLISFDKYEFRDINWSKDVGQPGILVVTSAQNKPDDILPLKYFYYPRRPVVLSVKEQIMSYPVDNAAYAMVATGK